MTLPQTREYYFCLYRGPEWPREIVFNSFCFFLQCNDTHTPVTVLRLVGIEAPTILPTIYASNESRYKNAAHLTHEDKNFRWVILKKTWLYKSRNPRKVI
jgi:hypothetical protein